MPDGYGVDTARFFGSLFMALLISMPALWWARKNPRPWASCLSALALSGLAAFVVAWRGIEVSLGILGVCWFIVWLFWKTRGGKLASGWTRLQIVLAALPAAGMIFNIFENEYSMAVFAVLTLITMAALSGIAWIAAGFLSSTPPSS